MKVYSGVYITHLSRFAHVLREKLTFPYPLMHYQQDITDYNYYFSQLLRHKKAGKYQ